MPRGDISCRLLSNALHGAACYMLPRFGSHAPYRWPSSSSFPTTRSPCLGERSSSGQRCGQWIGVPPERATAAICGSVPSTACIAPFATHGTSCLKHASHPLLPVQHLPGLYILGAGAMSLLLGGATRVIPFTLFGSYFSWAYLRFVQSRNGVR